MHVQYVGVFFIIESIVLNTMNAPAPAPNTMDIPATNQPHLLHRHSQRTIVVEYDAGYHLIKHTIQLSPHETTHIAVWLHIDKILDMIEMGHHEMHAMFNTKVGFKEKMYFRIMEHCSTLTGLPQGGGGIC